MRKKITLSIMTLSALALLGAGCVKKPALPANPADNNPPSIFVSDQSLNNNQVIIEKASIDNDGWLVIHKKQNGQPEAMIGYASLFKGETKKMEITIDKTNLTPSLIAMLHYDRGEKGAFEFPGADGPVIKDQQVLMKEFGVSNYAETSKDSSQAPIVNRKEFIITAKQWSFSPAVIKVKKGDIVVLKLKSGDVAHSLVIQEFKINAAIKPGETKTVEFIADKIGAFTSVCGVYCGVGHVGMTGTLIVE